MRSDRGATAANYGLLKVGARVVLEGLRGAPELNGARGTVGTPQGEDRFRVWLDGQQGWKAIRAGNLFVEPFRARMRVVVQGLEKAQHLNGIAGVVVACPVGESDRYEVEVVGFGHKALKATNLRAATDAEASEVPITIGVVAPGAGLRMNESVYAALRQEPGKCLKILGQSHAAYDRYPESWPSGEPAPNLQSFALDLLDANVVQDHDCLILGSRGGQVVLPDFWLYQGPNVPAAIVINGGCANTGDIPVFWPDTAVTLLLLGGQDYFRGDMSSERFMYFTKNRVPANNRTTAILFIKEMEHMPQSPLLEVVLRESVPALLAWQAIASPPLGYFRRLVSALAGWTGLLSYTSNFGAWTDIPIVTLGARFAESVTRVEIDAEALPDFDDSAGQPSIGRSETVIAVPLQTTHGDRAAPLDTDGTPFREGSRAEAFFEGAWYKATVMALPGADREGKGRWRVQCDVDPAGTHALVQHIRDVPTSPLESPSKGQADADRFFVAGGRYDASIALGSRVESLFEGRWFASTVVALPAADPHGLGRWRVQCDDDDEGLYTWVPAVRKRVNGFGL